MKGFTCLFVVFLVAISGLVFSEELVLPAETCSDSLFPANPLSCRASNLYHCQMPAANTVIATFSFLQEICIYNVTATVSDGGLVTPNFYSVLAGSNQTFIATPKEGYEVDQWFVFDKVVQEGGNTFTISNIQEDKEIHIWRLNGRSLRGQ